jgi:hypothetical protein
MSQVATGDRAYLKAEGLFGEVTRTTLLALPNSPVLLRDDGKVVAFAGEKVHEVVNKQTASDGITTIPLPVDVRVIGIQLLNQRGVGEDIQATMFRNFVALPRAQRDTFVAAFEAVDTSNPAELNAFLDNMVAGLTSQ